MSGPHTVPAKTRAPHVTSLTRPRLSALVGQAWQRTLTVVTAPPGSGKTTLLSAFASAEKAAGRQVAWYQAESIDADADTVLAYLEAALRSIRPALSGGWHSAAEAAAEMETLAGESGLLIIDDEHVLAATQGETVIAELIAYVPEWLHLVVAGRRAPGFDLSRSRLDGSLLEIGAEDLRFRAWEVVDLFREEYKEHVPTDELTELARRTRGWAAGLKLFHLATKGKPASERRAFLTSLPGSSAQAREYLARNVVAELEPELRDFMIRTSVLGRLSGPLCDDLLGTTGSAIRLADIERRHLFLVSNDDGRTYREHEVLKAYLEELLVVRLGEVGAIEEYRRAGVILESDGAYADALRAFCRASDWQSASRILSSAGEAAIDSVEDWADRLPADVVDHDAWVLLASARRDVASLKWAAAIETYRRAEAATGGRGLVSSTSRTERMRLGPWVDPTSVTRHWTAALRQALVRDPSSASTRADGANRAQELFVEGFVLLVEGRIGEARSAFERCSRHGSADPALAAWAGLASAVTVRLSGSRATEAEVSAVFEAIDPLIPAWLCRLARTVTTGDAESIVAEAEAVDEMVRSTDNPWAEIAVGASAAFALLGSGKLDASADRFSQVALVAHRTGAEVVRAWMAAFALVPAARTGDSVPSSAILEALGIARAARCRGAAMLAEVHEPASAAASAPVGAPGREWLGGLTPRRSVGSMYSDVQAPVAIRCLGPFVLSLGATDVDLDGVKPRVRSLIRMLAMNAGRPTHRDEICVALWDGDTSPAVTRSLHVAVSSARQLLQAQGGWGHLLVRKDDTYRLEADDSGVDHLRFASLARHGRSALNAARVDDAAVAFEEALALYRGDLLPEEGNAEWLLSERDRLRLQAADVAQALAEIRLDASDAPGAVAVALRGLAIDRYRDGLWRALIRAHNLALDLAAAARAEADYRSVLVELGVEQ